MRIILLIIKLFYYLFLLFSFLFLAIFPTDEYWNLISTIFFWLIGVFYIIKILKRNIGVDQLMVHGLIYFIIGIVISTIGIFVMGEIFLKLSFLVFMVGILGSFINYRKSRLGNNEKS